LYGRDLERALQDVIDFVELGDFLLQPFKTYSLGMRSRLQFAAATAIHPEILIIDEVLGAGDAYFSAKSAVRMKELTSTGCTLILVSHSMQQILQFCDRAIWLESGAIVMDDKALSVVRSYEEFCRRLEHEAEKARVRGSQASILSNDWLRRRIIAEVCDAANSETDGTAAGRLTPSRWPSEGGIRIANILARGSDGQQTWLLQSQMAADFEFVIEAEHNGEFRCRYVFVVFSDDGRLLSRHCSDYECFSACAGERRIVRLHFPTLLLGNGRFVASAAIYKELDLEQVNSAIPYDLLSRSFEFRVVAEHSDDPSMFHHPGEWQMSRAPS
jgi:lipopolysaccharide transport system ATP-binding protein